MRRESHVRFCEGLGGKFPRATRLVILFAGSQEQAIAEMNALAEHLRSTLGLELSVEKTKVTSMTDGFEFLGHRVRLKRSRQGGFYTALEIPKAKAVELRRKVKRLTGRSTTGHSLSDVFRRLNPILRGWGHFYRHCHGAHRILSAIDWYVAERCWRWMRRKHQKTGAKVLLKRYRRRSMIRRRMVWQEDGAEAYLTSTLQVERYRLGWMKPPDYATTSGEPDA
jgi:hypothetical protein